MNGEDERLARLYRSVAGEQPPAHLDAKILAAARAAGKGTRAANSPFARSWMVPTALAAVLVLTVGLVTFMGRHEVVYDEAAVVPMVERMEPDSPGPAPGSAADTAPPPAYRRQAPAAPGQPPAGAVMPPHTLRKTEEPGISVPGTTVPETRWRNLEEKRARMPKDEGIDHDPGSSASLDDPEQWIDDIRRLAAQGLLDEARDSLADFVRRYPDRRVPEDMKFLNRPE